MQTSGAEQAKCQGEHGMLLLYVLISSQWVRDIPLASIGAQHDRNTILVKLKLQLKSRLPLATFSMNGWEGSRLD